jgi:MinD-like ATPase involved in chromosome partitioning or flagellar assembly
MIRSRRKTQAERAGSKPVSHQPGLKKTVLIALDQQTDYQSLVDALGNEESATELEVSQNIDSQASLFYFLPKIKPHAAIISKQLAGEWTAEEMEQRIKELSPETEVWIYQGTCQPIVAGILAKPDLLQKIVAVWSPSGGVGKTEIAKSLALAAGAEYRVILLDANLCNPDIAGHLGIPYRKGHTLSTALSLWTENRLTPGLLREVLLPYDKIQVLIGNEDAIEQSDYSPSFFRDLLRTLSQMADFVIVDMDSDITSPAGISILLASHHVITPFNTSTATLGHGKVYLDLLGESYRMNRVKFDPILNRAGEGGTLSADDIELCMNRPVIASIPYDKAHLRAVCAGKPLVLGDNGVGKRLFRTLQTVVRHYAQKDVALP